MPDLYDYLFLRILLLQGPPWRLRVFDKDTMQYEPIGGTGGSGSLPVLSPLQQPLPAQPLTLRGDPPDVITTGGDLIIIAGHQPGFITDPSGDLVTTEGL